MKALPLTSDAVSIDRLLEAFLPHLLATLQQLETWCAPSALAAAAAEHVRGVVARAIDVAARERALQRFGQPHHTVDDFGSRLILNGSEPVAVADIHFKGLDPSQPFVELSLLDHRHPRVEDAVAVALDAFASLAPRRARAWFDSKGARRSHLGRWPLSPDQYCLVGELQSLKRVGSERPPLQLEPIRQPADSYRRYRALYAEYRALKPEIARELYLLPEPDFVEMAAQGTAYDAFFESRWAGVIAASSEPLWGQPGFVMREEFLAAEFRGRRLGQSLQKALIERLEAPSATLLWGTIHAFNLPSLRTALAVGRVPIGATMWIHASSQGKAPSP